MKNIVYTSAQIKKYYSASRRRWNDFYPSERWVFSRIASEQPLGGVLDIGCACGGLGRALEEKFGIRSYTGIEINQAAVCWAKRNLKLAVPATLVCADYLKVSTRRKFETVVSLSCADWNIRTKEIIRRAWQQVKPGGYFVISLRTTPGKGVNDIKKSYQYIDFFREEEKPEVANYVVFNFKEAVGLFKEFSPRPELIGAYGYWGRPSSTARTPFKRLIFAVFYIKKGKGRKKAGGTSFEFELPQEALAGK